MTQKLECSFQVCYESARQQSEIERGVRKRALDYLVTDARPVTFIDETHEHKQVSRRRKFWGVINSRSVAIKDGLIMR